MLTYEDIKIGKLYKYRVYVRYRPYEIVRVIDKGYFDMDNSGVAEPVIVFEYYDDMGILTIDSQSTANFVEFREPHCWNCKKELQEIKMNKCKECGWIICPECNSCGCETLFKTVR